MSNPNCALCNAPTTFLKYHGRIRAGSIGKYTNDDFSIFECPVCGVGFLTPTANISYENDDYRNLYNKSSLIDDYFSTHDHLQIQHLEMLGNVNFRNKVIADFGCGGGSLLDHLHGLAHSTIAIEPFSDYHPSLLERGHLVYSYGSDLLADYSTSAVDVAFSVHVIEHVDDPISYLREIYDSLAEGGSLYLTTPNHADILLEILFDTYAPFFYRTVHRWYFSAGSLRWLASQTGFREINIMYQQNYDLSNALCWLRDQKPTGMGKIDIFNSSIDSAWHEFLETSGRSDAIWAVMKK